MKENACMDLYYITFLNLQKVGYGVNKINILMCSINVNEYMTWCLFCISHHTVPQL